MTRIDTHPSHPSLDRPAAKAAANQSDGQDFLEHLSAGKPAARAEGRPAEHTLPLAGGNRWPRAEGDHDVSLSRLSAVQPTNSDTPADIGLGGPSTVISPNSMVQKKDLLSPASIEDADRARADLLDQSDTVQPESPWPAALPEVADLTQANLLTANAKVQTDLPMPASFVEVADQTRVFEQHWLANGYLSLIASASETGVSKEADGTIEPVLGSVDISHLQNAVTYSANPSPTGALPDGVAWPVMVEAPDSVIDTLPRSIERMARALGPLVAADQPWPERLLRVSQKADGKTALWVRDYGLSAEAIDPLVQHLRQLARHNGITLDRVVVNGTVTWHSESFQGES